MNVLKTSLSGVVVIEPNIHNDQRGFFLETFREDAFWDLIQPGLKFVQDNHSRSCRGVLRGLHLQTRRPQGKLVRVARGEIFDVAVDLRADSPSFGRWEGVVLNDETHSMLYVPPGLAHGFLVLSEFADVQYKCTDYYDPGFESGLRWNDKDVGIQWPSDPLHLSEKDGALPGLAHYQQPENWRAGAASDKAS